MSKVTAIYAPCCAAAYATVVAVSRSIVVTPIAVAATIVATPIAIAASIVATPIRPAHRAAAHTSVMAIGGSNELSL